MKFYKSYLTTFVVLLCSLSLFAAPTANITSANIRICNQGIASMSITLTGDAPWRLSILVVTLNADGTTNTSKNTVDQINQSPFTYNYSVSATTTFSIERVYDNSTQTGVAGNPTNTFTAYVDALPKPSAGTDQVLKCGAAQLNGTIDNPIHSIYWTKADDNNGTFDDNTKPNAIFTPSEVGSYILTINENNGSCIGKDDVIIEVQGIGSPSGTLSGNATICKTGVLNTAVQLTGTGPFNYTLSNGVTSIERKNISAGTDNYQFNVEGSSVYKISNLSDNQGCIASSENKIGSATVIDNKPNTNAGEDLKVCGLTQTLNAIPSKGVGTWSIISSTGTFSDINNPNSTVTVSTYGTHTLKWTENFEGCLNSDETTVRFDQQPTKANAGKDLTVYLQNEVILDATIPEVGSGIWTLLSGSVEIAEPTNPKTSLSLLTDDNHQLQWSVTNGECPASKDSILIVKMDSPPNGFSPNGDFKNDQFVILGGELIPNNQLIIVNSQGQTVITIKNDNNRNDIDTNISWDGNDKNGDPVEDGSYYYIFSGDGMETIKDFIIVKRN